MNTTTPDLLFLTIPNAAPVSVPTEFTSCFNSEVVFADFVYDEEAEVLTVTAGSERAGRFFCTGLFSLKDVGIAEPMLRSSTRRLVRVLSIACDEEFAERDAWEIAYKLTKGKTVRIAARWPQA